MKTKFYILSLAIGLSFGISHTSCSQKNAAGENYVLSPADFEKKMAELPNEQLLDIRTAEEVSSGKLKNSLVINFNSADFQEQALKQLDKSKPVMLYCYAGSRSEKAATFLRSQGYTVYDLDGGIAQWKKEGKEIVTNEESATTEVANLMKLASFQEKIAGDKPVLVDFSAVWCLPCKQMKPTIDKLAEEMKESVEVVVVDVDKQEDIATAYKVEAMPTLMLFKKSAVVWQKVGLTQEDELRAALTANK